VRAGVALSIGVLFAGCVPVAPPPVPEPEPPRMTTPPMLTPAPPEDAGIDPRLNARLDSIVAVALAEDVGSGAAVAVGRFGKLVHFEGYGHTRSAADAPVVTDSTLFDLASLTKVVVTTTAAMILEQEGRLQLDRPVAFYLPEFSDSAKAEITVRMLLTHRGGLEAYAQLYTSIRGREAYLREINARPLRHPPGTETVYSDWDMILLQLVIERIAGRTLDVFARERIFAPLGMDDTQFSPVRAPLDRVAAASEDEMRGGLIHGEVHDGNAWGMGGVAGHAGLFSNAAELAVFSQMLLNGGAYGGERILRPETLARWTAPQNPGSSRALGWDTPSGRSSAGRYFGPRSFGHTGFTGTSLWVDPERGIFVIILTNRVHISNDNPRHTPLRRDLADAVQEAVLNAPLIDWEIQR
jgi:CubicO group peptidase (beta-lactamase class C family)